MVEMIQLVSKVLVLDEATDSSMRIKAFCDTHNLLGVRAQPENVMTVLKSNIDLGGIFLSEGYDGQPGGGLALARAIHEVRPELPIFYRRKSLNPDVDSGTAHGLFRQSYVIEDIDNLGPAVSDSIFSLVYPNALVRGITEISKLALESQFKEIAVNSEAPYIVRDRIIYGELFTLIPLESNWCRGYMMLQTEEQPLIRLVASDRTHIAASAASFRDLNQILGEVTNLIWGSFKNRFVSGETPAGRQSQVPIVINHPHRYISFGSEDPQLCFKYTLTDASSDAPPLVIDQRFVFNLNWSPDNFKENEVVAEDLFESGELEIF